MLSEAVALVDALRRVDGVDLEPNQLDQEIRLKLLNFRKLTQAQLTRPQRPPATTTAIGEVGEFPRALASSCLELSYVMK